MSRAKYNLLHSVKQNLGGGRFGDGRGVFADLTKHDGIQYPGLKTSFLGGDEVGVYWNSSTWVHGNYNIKGMLDDLDKLKFPPKYSESFDSGFNFPQGVDNSTQSYLQYVNSLNSTPYISQAINKKNSLNENPLENRLVEKNPAEYNPLKDAPTLFRKFSTLGYDFDSVLQFAEDYGMLGGDTTNDKNQESILSWFWEIYHMKLCMRLYAHTNVFSSLLDSPLEDFFVKEGENEFSYEIKRKFQAPYVPAEYFVESINILPNEINPSDLRSVASDYIQKIVEDHLNYRIKINYPISPNSEYGELPLMSFNLDGLIGALWFQFYQYASGITKFGECKKCGEWFIQSDQKKEKWKQFCSDICRASYSKISEELNFIKDILAKSGYDKNRIFSERAIYLNNGRNFRADLILPNKKSKDEINLIDLKTTKYKENATDMYDGIFSQNENIKNILIVFNDGVWGRKRIGEWKSLGNLSSSVFKTFLKL